ncbi:MAG TPA: mismatch-specific DNA-glycosylase [Acetobacteraceae bacterium]|nr:mismatch-specific DNA-glycosylase [Acetobacteraceae bacterium]
MSDAATPTLPPTLPDLLREHLPLVFVGINPSLYSVEQGHYFARRTNRFWPCLSRSVLSLPVRRALGVETLLPIHDTLLPMHGIGFTDVVKRPTAKAAELGRGEFAAGAAALLARLQRYQPRVVCFQGMMGYRPVAAALGLPGGAIALGPQPSPLGSTRVFVVPSPSAANARFTPLQQTEWYDRLAAHLAAMTTAARSLAAAND